MNERAILQQSAFLGLLITLLCAAGTPAIAQDLPAFRVENGTLVTNSESDETFNVNLSNATAGATISDSQGVGTINNDDASNAPPVAVADIGHSTQVFEDVYIYVLANDSDPDVDALTVTSVTQPANGTVSIATLPANTLRFLATSQGTATFTYTLSDGNGGTDLAMVTVEVTGDDGLPF